MQRNSLSAFTVLESIITLAVSCLLIFIGSLKMESYESQLLLVNTEKQVKTAIEQAARISIVQHESISVMYLPDSSYLQFKGRKYSKKVIINKKIKLTNPTNFQISSKGAVAPRTITFSNGKDNKKLKLQMMWGRAIDE